ncbi:MAG: HDOD domain-containing protein [Acidobacteriota bacterium]|nr:HDOD domain-containing protein [Acidobacteriota bacterium]
MPMTTLTPDQVASRIGELPPMPAAASKVLRLLNEKETTGEDLRKVIETDPGLTTSVLRLVNSALFNLPQRITTLSHAIMLLGFLRLRSLTLASVVAGLKELIPPAAAQARDAVWEHSVNVAVAARALSVKANLAWSEEAFVAGLLHDTGSMILLVCEPDAYVAMLQSCEGELPEPEQERERLGLDHQQVGRLLLGNWNLAPQLVAAVGGHHGDEFEESEHGALVALVALADRMMSHGTALEACGLAATRLGFDTAQLGQLRDETMETVHEERGELLTL